MIQGIIPSQQVQRGRGTGSVDAVRGKIGYKGGTHFFDFHWKPGSQKKVEIGVSTEDAELSGEYQIKYFSFEMCVDFALKTEKKNYVIMP